MKVGIFAAVPVTVAWDERRARTPAPASPPAFRLEAGEHVLGMLGAARAATPHGQAASTAAERRPP
jgi:hypothetical protein